MEDHSKECEQRKHPCTEFTTALSRLAAWLAETDDTMPAPAEHAKRTEPDLTMLLMSKADAIRKEYQLAHGRPCDCSTPDAALHYGRAQGLEIAADIAGASLALEGSDNG